MNSGTSVICQARDHAVLGIGNAGPPAVGSETRICRQLSGTSRAQTSPIPQHHQHCCFDRTTQSPIAAAQNHHFVCSPYADCRPLDPRARSPCGSSLRLSISVPQSHFLYALLRRFPRPMAARALLWIAAVGYPAFSPVQSDMRLHQTYCTVHGKIPTFSIASGHGASENTSTDCYGLMHRH